MKFRIYFLNDARQWVDKKLDLKDLMAILMLGKEQDYSLKKYLDGYEVFAGSTLVGSVDKFGNLMADDKIYGWYKNKAKTEKDKMNELKAIFNSNEAVEEVFPTAVVEGYLNRRAAEEAAAASGAARNRAIAGSAALFKERFGSRVRLANGDTKSAEDFAEYLYNIYKKNRVFDKWYKIITKWYMNGVLDERNLDFIRDFINSVTILAEAHYDEYDENFNNLKPADIIKRFSKNAKEAASRERAESAQITRRETDYDIVQIKTQAEASKYAPYTSWCVTRSSFSGYCNINDPSKAETFYFMLKKGFKDVKRERGPGAPKDEYGLSMIAVSVKEDGSLFTSTTRWNHDMGGNDNSFKPRELGELAGGDFYQIFKPLTTEEERDKNIIASDNAFMSAKGGDNRIVIYNDKLYLVNQDKLIKDQYGYNLSFTLTSAAPNGAVLVRGEDDWIVINKNLEIEARGTKKQVAGAWDKVTAG